MEQEKKLYPFRFCSLKDEYGWGCEEFRLADLGYRDSLVADGWLAGNSLGEIMDMYLDRVVGEDVFERYGRQFPFEVKFLRVTGKMPLRVHPDDEIAGQRYDFLGKEKMWHIVRAGRNARLLLGFRKDTDASDFYQRCIDNSVEDILNVVAPMPGQTFHIAPGTPHAAFGDIVIAEVSESSPLDFCLCGWGQEVSADEFDPGLNLVEALDFINYSRYTPTADAPEQFTFRKLNPVNPIHVVNGMTETPVCYICVSGSASIQTSFNGIGSVAYPIEEGGVLLVPAENSDFIVAPTSAGTVLLEITIDKKDSKDIGPWTA